MEISELNNLYFGVGQIDFIIDAIPANKKNRLTRSHIKRILLQIRTAGYRAVTLHDAPTSLRELTHRGYSSLNAAALLNVCDDDEVYPWVRSHFHDFCWGTKSKELLGDIAQALRDCPAR